MTKEYIPEHDMFSLRESDLIKERINKKVSLNKKNLSKITIPSNFIKKEIKLTKDNYPKQIRKFLNPIAEEVENIGYGANIYTALYEGVLNSFQHGNKYNPDKKLCLAKNINKEKLEFIIADECVNIPADFLRFVLAQRERDLNSSFLNWYKFSGSKQSDINNGTGTSFMNQYMDKVQYFVSEDTGGLGLYLVKFGDFS